MKKRIEQERLEDAIELGRDLAPLGKLDLKKELKKTKAFNKEFDKI